MPDPLRLVATSVAARAVGVDRTTLFRWWQAKKVTTPYRTPSGHLRWDIADLRAQLASQPLPQPTTAQGAPLDTTDTPAKPIVATAITTSHLGVLVGRRNDGNPEWTFIAGKCHEGEAPRDAAVREVKEETGLNVVAGRVPIGRRIHPKTGWDMIYMACQPTEGTEVFVGDEEELAEVRWVASLAELDVMMKGMIFDPVHEHLSKMLAA